jgi:hypothetical protein
MRTIQRLLGASLAALSWTLPGPTVLPTAVPVAFALGCRGGPSTAFADVTEARQLAADLRVQFSRASDASNRAVMADTDEASVAFADEAVQIKASVQTDVSELALRLGHLGYAAEIQLLDEFRAHFAEYDKVDHDVLELAVENTNLKAQRLSFGAAREAADAFRDALAPLAARAPSKGRCRVESLVAKAVLAVRDIQVLQAPHIAESDEAAMTRMEGEMATLNATARDALAALPDLVDAEAQPQVATATDALARFEATTREIVRLSRRNSNVRSLELSVRRKPAVMAACDQSLRVLQDALAKDSFRATR